MQLDAAEMNGLGSLAELLLGYALDLAAGVVILLLGWLLAGWARRLVLRLLDRTPHMDRTLKPVLASIARYTVLVFVLVAVLAQFGVQTASIIALLGAAGIAVGLALQGTLQNIAAGMMLLFLRPFQVGEYVSADGVDGTVEEVGLFVTTMTTFDGLYRSVPNAKLWNATITNYDRLPTRRLDITIGVSYDDSIEAARRVLTALLEDDRRVMDEPGPQVLVGALSDSSVDLILRCWCAKGDYWPLAFDLRQAAKERLEAEGLTIPFPQREVRVVEEGKLSD
ncbi:mechanosensitive ion channel domain-containing protein [Pelagibius sp. CAU 1746]|uniref:mechanosensitive ion channel family protein n=1 Tax=Pelagibius sp. CAU 1746 TaxID=3140370 RepID=UPI00325C2C27